MFKSYTWFGRYWAVAHALRMTGGNRQRTARLLGIERAHLYALLNVLKAARPVTPCK